eukprot:m.31836 g.31836  ORF g.31836 m.31836 type:complete len:310 (+) comp9850_c0_seq2:86-1015(+)
MASRREKEAFRKQMLRAQEAQAKAETKRQADVAKAAASAAAGSKRKRGDADADGRAGAGGPVQGRAAPSRPRQTIDKSLSSAIYKIHTFLKQRYMDAAEPEDAPMQADNVFQIALGKDVPSSQRHGLLEALTGRPKIGYDADRDTLVFQPKFPVRNYDQLLACLETLSREGEGGMRTDDLSECYKGVMDDVERLKTEKKVLVIRREKDKGLTEVLHFREAGVGPSPAIDNEVQTLWKTTSVADKHAMDIRKHLTAHSLKPLTVERKVTKANKKPKRRKKTTGAGSLKPSGGSGKLMVTDEDAMAANLSI